MQRKKYDELIEFVIATMKKMGCDEEQAGIVAKVLVEADARGISSHGVARLRRYVSHIKDGIIDVYGKPEIVFESSLATVIDGNKGVGQWISQKAVEGCIEKASKNGVAFTVVRNSNHFGIAGYYAEMASEKGMIGLASTNTAPLVVPTFGKEALLGTNPIAVSFPVNKDIFLLDMATSVAARGKVEVYNRLNKNLPRGWAVDENGKETTEPSRVIDNLKKKSNGGILPLGGAEELSGGHKGYGLSLLVELLTAGLSVGDSSAHTYQNGGKICHFFGAIKLDQFGSSESIQNKMENILQELRVSDKATGEERIYIHGEKEKENRARSIEEGVPLDDKTVEYLKEIAEEFSLCTNVVF